MTVPTYQRRLHWFAISTVFVLMTTLSAGALVTSKNAGMAFRDWPTSDGRAMLSYPWLQDFARDWDKFLEHGHRLAGVLIGCWVLTLAGLLSWFERRGWVQMLSFGLVGAVIVQGILGGFRVQLDERGLAMIHGFFAACVTALLATIVTVLSRGWFAAEEEMERTPTGNLGLTGPLAFVTMGLITAQYLLGGAIRHHHTGLHEHLGVGLMTVPLTIANAVAARRTGVRWLAASANGLVSAVLFQVLLGAGTWVHKWGFTPTGFVATADSVGAVGVRSLHMVFGVLVFASAVVHAVRVCRVASLAQASEPQPLFSPPLPQQGGAA